MNTKSISATNLDELHQLLEETINNEFKPTLAIAFCDPEFELEKAVKLFKYHDINLTGCNSSGEIHDNNMNQKSFSALLLDIKEDDFKTLYVEGSGNDYSIPANKIGEFAKASFDNPAILVYSGGVGIDGESIVKGIKQKIDKEIPIYGGQGSDNFIFKNVNIFNDGKIYQNGITALIINADKISVKGKAYSGWNELGVLHTITKAEGNVIYEIDNKPALDVFNNYFPTIKYTPQENSEQLFTIPGIYPLKIKRKNGVEFLRSGMIYDFENKALILAGGVLVGDEFKFCPTPNFEVVDDTIREFNQMHKKIGDVDAVIINSCAGRLFAFGPMFDDEVEGLYKIWKKPTIGYMAYGEIGNVGENEICEFHNVSCSLVTLTEK